MKTGNAEMAARLRSIAGALQGARNGAELLADQLDQMADVATQAEVAAAHVEAATHAARVVRLESEVRRLRVDLDEARHTIHKREEQVRQLVAMLDGAAK